MRIKPLRSFIVAFAVVGLVVGCKREQEEAEPAATRQGHDFFPLETGRFVEYDVVETQHLLASSPVVKTSQLREVVKSVLTDASGQPAYRLERFRRDTDTQHWRLDSVWTARREAERAVKTEGNVAFVKLVFPTADGLRWNGNALNDRGRNEYRIRRHDEPATVNGQRFDRTLEVLQREDSSLVSLQRRLERYARGVGLVYWENTALFYCNSPGCLGKGTVDFGRQTVYRIRKHGKE